MPIPKPSEDAEGALKWLIGFLILLFIVWLLTGGPARYQKLKPGPTEPPPPPPVVEG